MSIDACLAELSDLPVDTQPQRVRRRSRAFCRYSPILERRLEHVTADAVVTPRSEEEVHGCWPQPSATACR